MRAAWAAVLVCVAACGAQPTPDAGMVDSGSLGGGAGGGSGGGSGGGGGEVDAGACPVCEDWAVCEARLCSSRALSIVWHAPGDQQRVDAGLVALRAEIIPYASRVPFHPPTLSARLVPPDGGAELTLTLERFDGGHYAATTPLDRGTWEATTSLGPISATQRFDVGAPPPELRVTVRPADAGVSTLEVTFEDPAQPVSYRRDELVPVRVELVSGEADAGTLRATLRSGAESFPLPSTACPADLPCATSACQCFVADLAAPRLDAFRGTMHLEAGVISSTGEEAVVSSLTTPPRAPSLPVTRWAWRRRFFQAQAALAVEGPWLAIDDRGRLLVAERQQTTSATASITAHGQLAWTKPLYAPAPLVVGTWVDGGTVVHVPRFESGVSTFSTATGDLVAQAMPPGPHTVAAPMALLERPSGGSVLAGLSHPGDVYSHRPFAWSPQGWQVTNSAFSSGTMITAAGDGDSLLWSHLDFMNSGRVSRLRFQASGWDAGSLESTAFPPGAEQVLPTSEGVVLGTSEPSSVSWARWETDGGVGSNVPGMQVNGFTMSTEDELFGIRMTGSSTVELVRQSLGAQSPSARAALPSLAFGGPALGTGDLVYVADTAGAVRAFRRQDLVEAWSGVVPAERFEGALQLDCARDAQGNVVAGRPGRLLAVGTSGRAYSFIVDSRGVDPQATWPLQRHDPANTNNPRTPLSRFVCP